MKFVTLDLTRTLDLSTKEATQTPVAFQIRNYDYVGLKPGCFAFSANVSGSGVLEISTSVDEQTARQLQEAQLFLYVISNSKIERVPESFVRWFLDGTVLRCQFIYEQPVTSQLAIFAYEKLYHAQFVYLAGQKYTYQLVIEHPEQVSGTCVAGEKTFSLTNGVNVISAYGDLKIELYANPNEPIAVVPIIQNSQVVFKNVDQLPGALVQVSESFTQVRGSLSQNVSKTNPSLDTRTFSTFDVVASQDTAQPVLTFSLGTPLQYAVVHRVQNDVLVSFQLVPGPEGFMPVLSKQTLRLEG